MPVQRTEERFYERSSIINPKTPIEGLITKLEESGIPSNRGPCIKRITMTGAGSEIFRVPLFVEPSLTAQIIDYEILSGIGHSGELKIELQDSTLRTGSGVPENIGYRTGERGVSCKISYKNNHGDASVVDEAIGVLDSFYALDFNEVLKSIQQRQS